MAAMIMTMMHYKSVKWCLLSSLFVCGITSVRFSLMMQTFIVLTLSECRVIVNCLLCRALTIRFRRQCISQYRCLYVTV